MASKRVSVIAAACKNNGIGFKGDLPWRLKNEMAFFTRTTKTTDDPSKKNAVVMGRKTWECIPPKYRPLAGRVNVVLSETLADKPSGADYLFKNLPEAINSLQTAEDIEKVFVIGGARAYKDAMSLEETTRIYLTKIDAEFECDAFFPEMDLEQFAETADERVPSDPQEENGLNYKFYVYERVFRRTE